jgi:hypothetical protein
MNSRRLSSSMGDFRPYALSAPPTGPCSVFRTFSLPQVGPQVLGADLNRSELTIPANATSAAIDDSLHDNGSSRQGAATASELPSQR